MGETLYRKVGRRYEPIAWHEERGNLPEGAWLVVVTRKKGSRNLQQIRVKTDMDIGRVSALARFKTVLVDKIMEAQRPSVTIDRFSKEELKEMTKEQKNAMDAVKKAFNDRPIWLSHKALHDVIIDAVHEVEDMV